MGGVFFLKEQFNILGNALMPSFQEREQHIDISLMAVH